MNLILFSGLAGVLMMISGLFMKQKRTSSWLAMVLIAVLLLLNTLEMSTGSPLVPIPLKDMLMPNKFGLLINEIVLIAGLMYFVVSGKHIEAVGTHVPDYYALLFFIYAGIGIVTSFTNLLMLFIGIEIISIPLYILTASDKRNLKK